MHPVAAPDADVDQQRQPGLADSLVERALDLATTQGGAVRAYRTASRWMSPQRLRLNSLLSTCRGQRAVRQPPTAEQQQCNHDHNHRRGEGRNLNGGPTLCRRASLFLPLLFPPSSPALRAWAPPPVLALSLAAHLTLASSFCVACDPSLPTPHRRIWNNRPPALRNRSNSSPPAALSSRHPPIRRRLPYLGPAVSFPTHNPRRRTTATPADRPSWFIANTSPHT